MIATRPAIRNRRSRHSPGLPAKPSAAALAFTQWALVIPLALTGPFAASGQTLNPAQSASSPAASSQTKAARAAWGRIVMVGASASAGFTESEPLGGPNTARHCLSRYVDAALRVPHEPVRNLANTTFFLQPAVLGRQQVDQALKAAPTLVVGLDFLFWFCYGEGNTDAERLRRFESGLTLLEAIPCPLILGDIPDASGAAETMLAPEQIPSPQARSAANRRLKQWAAGRNQVVILPLSGFMAAATANQALTVHGHTLPGGKTRGLLQTDQLHPSPQGCAILALSVLDAFQSKQPAIDAADVRWDSNEVLQLVSKSLAPK